MLVLRPFIRIVSNTAVHRCNDKKRPRKEQLYDGTFGKPRYGICPSRHVWSRILP